MWMRGLQFRHICLFALIPALLCGCWDRTETNDLAFVLSSSVDLEDNGMVRIAYLLPLPGQMGGASGGGGGTSGGKSYYVDSEVGSSIREAAAKMQRRIPRRIFLAHRRTVVIGEAYAKKGINELFDVIPRLPESRLNTFLAVTKGKAYSLLNAQPKFERFSAEAIREMAKPPFSMPVTMKDVGLALSSGRDPVIAYMQTAKIQKGKAPTEQIEVAGLAQFQGDRMVGLYKNQSALAISWLNNTVTDSTVTVSYENGKEVSIRVLDGGCDINPTLNDGQLHFQIDITIVGKVREDMTAMDLSDPQTVRALEKKMAANIKKNVQSAVKQMQQKGTDSCRLAEFVHEKYPDEWPGLKANWTKLLSQANFDIHSGASIAETGLIIRNVVKREGN